MRRVLIVLFAGLVVAGGVTTAWAVTTTSATGTTLCVPQAGASLTTPVNGSCPRGSQPVTVANLAGVQAIEQRLADAEAAIRSASAGSGATEARIATTNWGSAGCSRSSEGMTGWVFPNCTDDPTVPVGFNSSINATYGKTMDTSRYPPATMWTMELRHDARSTVCVRLYDLTARAVVTGTETCFQGTGEGPPAPGRGYSAPFELPLGEHDYVVQSNLEIVCRPGFSLCHSQGHVSIPEIIARW